MSKTIRYAMNYALESQEATPLREAKLKAFNDEDDEVSLETPYSVFIMMLLTSRAYFQFETSREIVKIYGDNSMEHFSKH